MKRICYVLIHPQGGAIATVSCIAQQKEDDDVNLKLFRPDNLRGEFKAAVGGFNEQGFGLCNWHVVESDDDQKVTTTMYAGGQSHVWVGEMVKVLKAENAQLRTENDELRKKLNMPVSMAESTGQREEAETRSIDIRSAVGGSERFD